MPPNKSRVITINLISMHMCILRWSRANLETVFNFKGKPDFLTMEQCSILMHIQRCEKITVSGLAQVLCLSKSSISLTISKLVSKNLLVKKQPDAYEDKRKTYFYLTPHAQVLLQSTQNNLLTTVDAYFNTYDQDKQDALLFHLDAITQILISGGKINEK